MINRNQLIAALRLVIADFKTVEVKFIEQGVDKKEVSDYIAEFKKLRDGQKIKGDSEKNIDYWGKKPFEDFVAFIDDLKDLPAEIRRLKQKKIEGAELVAENADWFVYSITTYGAAKFLADDTDWCIKYVTHWDSYSANSDFYFYISKNRTDKWKKIALQLKETGKIFWDNTDNSHSNMPENLNVPEVETKYVPRIEIDGKNVRIDTLKSLPPNSKFKKFPKSAFQYITSLPEGFSVSGTLDLGGTEIKELPERLAVFELILTDSKITELPRSIKADNLVLTDSLITEIPEGIKLIHIDLRHSKVTKIPYVNKLASLDLRHTKNVELLKGITLNQLIVNETSQGLKLPSDLSILESLNLKKLTMDELPDNLEIHGNLYLPNGLKKLPSGLNVENIHTLQESGIKDLPKDLRCMFLDISNMPIDELPTSTYYKDLNIKNTRIKKLPDLLKVERKLDIRGTEIDKLPEQLEVGTIYLNDKITSIALDIKINTLVYVRENQLKEIPSHLEDKIIEYASVAS